MVVCRKNTPTLEQAMVSKAHGDGTVRKDLAYVAEFKQYVAHEQIKNNTLFDNFDFEADLDARSVLLEEAVVQG